MANSILREVEDKSKSKLKDKLDIEVLDWFFFYDYDWRQKTLKESKAKNWKDLVKYLREKY